jgi:hypothetical protein
MLTAVKQPRGIRNNNPLNIERTDRDRWVGMADAQTDPRFVVFDAPEHGIRAAALILQRYQDRYGCRTIREIIARWAPPDENPSDAYAAAVARAVGVGLDDPIDVQDYRIARPLIEAMIRQENGCQPYPAHVIDEGLRRAGIVPDRPRSIVEVARTDTAIGSVAATVPTAAAGAVAAVAPQLVGLDWRVAVAAIVAVAVVAVVAVLIWRSRRD